MPGVFIGSTEIVDVGKIKVGSTDVQEVYVGSTKIWPAAAGGFNPDTDIAGLIGWWKFSEGVTVTGSGVSEILDQSTLNSIGALTQTTDAARPPLGTGGANGQPYGDFDGTDFLPAAIAVVASTEFTIFSVTDFAVAINNQTVFSMLNGSTLHARVRVRTTPTAYRGFSDAGVDTDTGTADGATTAIVFRSKPASAGGDVIDDEGNEGVDVTGAPSGTGQFDRCTMGSRDHTSAINPWVGKIYEVGIYNSSISDSDRTSLIDYLKSEYGL